MLFSLNNHINHLNRVDIFYDLTVQQTMANFFVETEVEAIVILLAIAFHSLKKKQVAIWHVFFLKKGPMDGWCVFWGNTRGFFEKKKYEFKLYCRCNVKNSL